MNKTVSVVTIIVIMFAVFFAGCAGIDISFTEKSTGTPTVTEPSKETVTFKDGYKWYQDDEFGYIIRYPENWDKDFPFFDTGVEDGVVLFLPSNTPDFPRIIVYVVSDPDQLGDWDCRRGKFVNLVSILVNNITINSRNGCEVVWSNRGETTRQVLFTVNDLYYIVRVEAGTQYSEYASTFDDAINSFVISSSKNDSISPEYTGTNKSKSPNITDISLKISKFIDENENVERINITTNISFNNPNPVPFSLTRLDYNGLAMYKKGVNFRNMKNLPINMRYGANQIIMPMGTYIYSYESSTSDNDIIKYFTSEETKYIKIKGFVFFSTNETGWSPAYFEPNFYKLLTITLTKPEHPPDAFRISNPRLLTFPDSLPSPIP